MTTPNQDYQEPTVNQDAQSTQQPASQPNQALTPDQEKKTEGMLSALGTTALVSILLSWAVMVVYFSYFPPVPKEPPQPKIMAVDMMMVGVTIAQMTEFDEKKTKPIFDEVQQKLTQLREQGVIVLDAGNVIALPPELVIEPQDLISNVPEDVIERNKEALKMKTQTKMNMVTVPGIDMLAP